MEKNKKVLIIRISSLGDVIFNIPLAHRFKENNYEVTFITGPKGYNVIKNNPAVDETIYAPFDKWKKQSIFKTVKEYFSIIKYIRQQHFDVAVDTHGLLKSGIFLLLSGAKKRIIASDAREFTILAANKIMPKSHFTPELNIIERYQKYADFLNLNKTEIKFTLPPSTQETKQKVDVLLQDIEKNNKPLVVVAPATTYLGKFWDRDNWKTLISKIENSCNLVFTGNLHDTELIDYISNGKHLSLAGKTNVLELAEICRRSKLVLSVDSGSAHVARACNSPKVITIFCGTPKELYAPVGPKDMYLALQYPSADDVFEVACNFLK